MRRGKGIRTKITDYRDRALSKEAQGKVPAHVKDSLLPRRVLCNVSFKARIKQCGVKQKRSSVPLLQRSDALR